MGREAQFSPSRHLVNIAITHPEKDAEMPNNSAMPPVAADIEITLPSSVKRFASASTQLMMQAPHLVVLLIIVGAFLFHLDRLHQRAMEEATKIDQVTELRIGACRDVQERSTDALNDLSKQMAAQNEGFRQMSDSMEELTDIIKQRM